MLFEIWFDPEWAWLFDWLNGDGKNGGNNDGDVNEDAVPAPPAPLPIKGPQLELPPVAAAGWELPQWAWLAGGFISMALYAAVFGPVMLGGPAPIPVPVPA